MIYFLYAYKKVYSEVVDDSDFLLILVSIRLSKTLNGKEHIGYKLQLEVDCGDDVGLRKFTTFSQSILRLFGN